MERVIGGDRRDELVQRYMPLAKRLARRYERSGEPLDDLVQVASIGLLKAIDRFDPGREVRFETYAIPTILGELKRHFRDRTWSVRVPRDLQELALRVDRAASELSLQLGRSPSIGELAQATGVSLERVAEALAAASAYRAASLDHPEAVGPEALAGEDPALGDAEHRATLAPLLRAISPREREVLALRFGGDLTQSEIAARLGISQMHVSRLIRQALERLRDAAEDGEGG